MKETKTEAKSWAKIRQEIIDRDGLICQYCGDTVYQKSSGDMQKSLIIEHINSRSNDISNLCVACRQCNSKKNSRTAILWYRQMQQQIAESEALKAKCLNIIDLLRRLK